METPPVVKSEKKEKKEKREKKSEKKVDKKAAKQEKKVEEVTWTPPQVSLAERLGTLGPLLMATGGGDRLHPVPDCTGFYQLRRGAVNGISHLTGKWRKAERAAGVCTGVFVACQLVHAACAIVQVCRC